MLATDFNLAFTQDKEQRQLISPVVEKHGLNMALPLEKDFAGDE